MSQDSKAYRIYNPASGNVVESRNVTFIETPAYSMPLDVPDDDRFYEGDVLSFASILGGVSTTEDAFDGLDALDTVDLQTEKLLRQEIRRIRHNNVIREELQQRSINNRHCTASGHVIRRRTGCQTWSNRTRGSADTSTTNIVAA